MTYGDWSLGDDKKLKKKGKGYVKIFFKIKESVILKKERVLINKCFKDKKKLSHLLIFIKIHFL